MKTLTDRRAFLTKLGIGIPASVLASEAEASVAPIPDVPSALPMSPQEAFTIYVSEALNYLPSYYDCSPSSNLRHLIEAQGAALAMVFAHLQSRK